VLDGSSISPRQYAAALSQPAVRYPHAGRPGHRLLRAVSAFDALAENPSTPPAHAARVAEGIRGARPVVIPKAAHLADVGHADPFNSALIEELA